jgi:hypothetical protein
VQACCSDKLGRGPGEDQFGREGATRMSDSTLLTEFGVPAGGLALFYGMIRVAEAIEKDASEPALRLVSGLLVTRDLTHHGTIVGAVVPLIFDKIFGKKPFSLRFLFGSFASTTLFWLVLLALKHPDWLRVWQGVADRITVYAVFLPAYYAMDWVSLIKARFLMRVTASKERKSFVPLFLCLDIACSYILAMTTIFVARAILFGLDDPVSMVGNWVLLSPLLDEYLANDGQHIWLDDVMVPSSLFTSLWTVLFSVSLLIVKLLWPLDQIRRFTAFWFRDVEKHPLTAIAKVAGTLVIVAACLIKAVRWLSALLA